MAYLILAKQKKVSRPPRRQSGIGTLRKTQLMEKKDFDRLSPNGEKEIRKRAF